MSGMLPSFMQSVFVERTVRPWDWQTAVSTEAIH